MHLLPPRLLLLISTLAVVATSLLAPASASALLVGAESNGKLVNSNVTDAERAIELDRMQRQGAQVVRGNWGWNEVAVATCAGQTPLQLEDHNNPCYDWSRLDAFVAQATARNIQLLLSFTRNPAFVNLNPNPLFMGTTTTQFTNVLNHYVAFHKAVGTRYNGTSGHGLIRYVTIHNEPNSRLYWAPAANPQRYALLYARTAVALKAAHPTVQIAPGPTGPTGGPGGIRPRAFLKSFQTYATKYLPGTLANKRRYINAYAHNPYPGTTSQPSVMQGRTPPHPDAVTMSTISRLFKQLDASPLTKGTKVWATEFGWETKQSLFGVVSPARQAQFIPEAFHWLDATNRVAIGISYGVTDPIEGGDWQSGTFNADGTAKLSFKMFQRMVSVPKAGPSNRIRRGTLTSLWGRSNINPKTGVLAFKQTGSNVWRIVPGQRRRADGSIVATMRMTARQYQVAVYDKGNPGIGVIAGYGLTRVFSTF